MFKVEPIAREQIDAWTIRESGLPTRVVNGARLAHIETIGELRRKKSEELIAMRAIGRISVRDIARFFDLCRRMEKGTLVFLTIQEVFDLFLDREEMDILARRYGLLRTDYKASSNFMTLQEIGNELQLTRERIRQVENIALSHLTSRLATHCLQPFYLYLSAFINSRGKVITCDDARDLEGQSWLSGYNPCSILLLLHQLNPDPYTEHNGIFSTLSREVVGRAEVSILEFLADQNAPTPLPDLVRALDAPAGAWSAPALGKLLDHCAPVAATTDGRYFLFTKGCEAFLVELLQGTERPVHYRTLTNLLNNHLKPACRKGNGYILKLLNASDRFVKTERGYYDLSDR